MNPNLRAAADVAVIGTTLTIGLPALAITNSSPCAASSTSLVGDN